MWIMSRTPGIISGTAGFTGIGDITAASGFWGLRGYNSAYNTGSNPAIDVYDTATGLIGPTTINITTAGVLDTATILGLGYAVSVSKFYDQVGTNHFVMSTIAKRPALVLSVVGGTRPVLRFDGTNSVLSAAGYTLSQPFSMSMVFSSASSGSTGRNIFGDAATDIEIVYSSANTIQSYAGTGLSRTKADDTFHGVQFLFSGNSSVINVNGATTTGAAGATTPLSSDTFTLGAFNTTSFQWKGDIAEFAVFSGDKSGSFSSFVSNQQSWYGI